MIDFILWSIIVLLIIGYWVQHREIGLLIKMNEDNEQMILDGVWLLKKHIIKAHKASFKDAEHAEIIG